MAHNRSTHRSNRQRTRLVGAGAVAVTALVLVLAIRGGDADETGSTDAADWDLPVLDAGPGLDQEDRVRLADHAGQPLVVNFFASWCTSCEAELPDFRAVADATDGTVGFVFVNSNETGNWRPMAERTGISDRTLARDTGGTRSNGLYRSLGGSGGMPMTAFYDAEGQLAHVDLGMLSRRSLENRLVDLFGLETR
ncbi:MAG: TlpA family protein disulfide reductase [Actinobacteria bacterium]|nr:TlpA family protein disulfide reductase [Actinomycetota bacterium]